MDPRIRKQAEILTNHSTDIQKGDHVVVASPTAGEDLVQALYEKIGEKGATATSLMIGDNLKRAYLLSTETNEIIEPTAAKSLFADADAIINIRAEENMAELSDVPPEKLSQYNRVREDIQEIRLSKKWCVTQHPTDAKANMADMYIEDYKDFVYNAINQDWESQRKFQEKLVDILNPGETVRIVSGDTTDI
jgi:aminopeptidase